MLSFLKDRFALLWLAWLAITAALTYRILIWSVEYFRNPGPGFYRAALVLIPILVAAISVYAWVRRFFLWRFEPFLFVSVAVAATAFYEPRALLASLLLFFAAAGLGELAAGGMGILPDRASDRIALRCGIGFGIAIVLLFLLGEFHALTVRMLSAFIAILLLTGLRGVMRTILDLRSLLAAWSRSPELRDPIVGIAAGFGFVALICTLTVMLAPPIAFDVLQMHVPSVRHYAETASITPFPEIDYSYYPQGGETLWTAAYLLAGVAGMQMESVLFFALFLLALFVVARRAGLTRAAAVAGIFWAAMLPFLHWTGSVAKNDMMMAFFQALALYSLQRWMEERRLAWILAGVFFVAESFGVKNVALLGSVPLGLLAGYALLKQPPRWRAAALAAAVFLLFGGFWTLRTFLLTGDPAYPSHVSNAVSVPARRNRPESAFVRLAKTPERMLFEGDRLFESPLKSPAGILLFAFLPLLAAAAPKWKNPAMAACLFFTAVYLIYWAGLIARLRYAILPLAILAFLLAQGAESYWRRRRTNWIRASVVSLEVYCLLIAILGVFIIEVNGPQIAYFFGRATKSEYLRSALRTYTSLEFLNRVARPGEAIFGVDNCSRAYAPSPLQFQCMLCNGPCRPEGVAPQIAANRPRYVILPSAAEFGIEQVLPGVLAVAIYRDDYFSIYRIGG